MERYLEKVGEIEMNLLKVRKWGAFALCGFLPMAFALTSLFLTADVWTSIAAGVLGMVIMIFAGTFIYRHPMMGVIEGDGILGITMDSTGVMTPFLLKVATPYLTSKLDGEAVRTTFDRQTVNYLMNPKKGTIAYGDDGKLHLTLDQAEYKNDIMNLGGIPTLFYNKHMGAFMSKEMLSKHETETFVQHLVLHLNRRTDELSSNVRDFARYIVEQTRPKSAFWAQPWFIGVVIIVIIIAVAVTMGPQILTQLGILHSAPAAGTAVVTPTPTAVLPGQH